MDEFIEMHEAIEQVAEKYRELDDDEKSEDAAGSGGGGNVLQYDWERPVPSLSPSANLDDELTSKTVLGYDWEHPAK